MRIYQVIGWNENFEGAKSRQYAHKSMCQMPTKHGLGYRKLIRMENGPALFGAWCSMIQILSRQAKPRQGILTDDGTLAGKPLTASDLALLTGIDSDIFRQMLDATLSEDVGWMKVATHADTTRIPRGYRKDAKYTGNYNSNYNSNSNSNSNEKETPKSTNTQISSASGLASDAGVSQKQTGDGERQTVLRSVKAFSDMVSRLYNRRANLNRAIGVLPQLLSEGVSESRIIFVCENLTHDHTWRAVHDPQKFVADFSDLERKCKPPGSDEGRKKWDEWQQENALHVEVTLDETSKQHDKNA